MKTHLYRLAILCCVLLPLTASVTQAPPDVVQMHSIGHSMDPWLAHFTEAQVDRGTPFASIQVGDVIVWRHSRAGLVLHVVFKRLPDGSLWTRGTHNRLPDDEAVTPVNYVGRVANLPPKP